MAFFPLPKKFNPDFAIPGKKPVGQFELDNSSSLTRNLQACITQTDRGIWDLITDAGPDSGAGTRADTIGPKGKAREYTSGSDFFITTSALDSVTEYTWLVVADFKNYNDWHFSGPFAKTSNYSTTNSFQMFKQGGTGTSSSSIISNSSTSSGTVTGAQIEASSVLASKWDGSDVKAFTDAGLIVSTALATTPATGAGWIKVCSNRDTHDTDATHYITLVWDRALSDAEIQSVIRDPYQILKPVTQTGYFTAEATGATTVNLTGQSVATSQGALTVTGAASVALTGQAITSTQGIVSVTTGGAISVGLTGQEITLGQGSLSVSGAASVGLTGQAITTGQGVLAAAGAANVTLSGLSSTSALGSVTVTIEATPTVVNLLGQAITVQNGILGLQTANVITLVGQSITVSEGTVTVIGDLPSIPAVGGIGSNGSFGSGVSFSATFGTGIGSKGSL